MSLSHGFCIFISEECDRSVKQPVPIGRQLPMDYAVVDVPSKKTQSRWCSQQLIPACLFPEAAQKLLLKRAQPDVFGVIYIKPVALQSQL